MERIFPTLMSSLAITGPAYAGLPGVEGALSLSGQKNAKGSIPVNPPSKVSASQALV